MAADREQMESDMTSIMNEKYQLMDTMKAQLELKESDNMALKR